MNAALGPAGAGGRIGPNAITRVAEVRPAIVGSARTLALFDAAGLAPYLRDPPLQMVDETEVARLHGVLRTALDADTARQGARRAGTRTGDYLLAHRIPRPVQRLLKALPAALAARVLLAAIRRHAWTFCGSGAFSAVAGMPVVLSIQRNPLCRGVTAFEPVCDFYTATFERLFQVLVHRDAQVRETACEALGDPQCRFEVAW
jgi:divinyl protochlorophyllide a 8-vinyl-reductase